MIAALMGYSLAHAGSFLRPVAGLPTRLTRGWSASCYAAALAPLLAMIAVVCLVARFG